MASKYARTTEVCCPTCQRPGWRQTEDIPFWLPEEESAGSPWRRPPHLPPGSYFVQPRPGAMVSACCLWARTVADDVKRRVWFVHNDVLTYVDPGEDPRAAFARWSSR